LTKQETIESNNADEDTDEEAQATGMGLTRDHHLFLHLGYYLLDNQHIKQFEDNFFFSFQKSKRHPKDPDLFADLLSASNVNHRSGKGGGTAMG